MSRIRTPATIEAAPAASQPLLQAVKKQIGIAPNLFRLVANSPIALEGYVSLFGALGKGDLPPAVALNTWTNYINTVGRTEIDFPVIEAHRVA
jgi:hypothetical protein